jgi:phospholipid transport system substrate-binding protein
MIKLCKIAIVLFIWPALVLAASVAPMDLVRNASEQMLLQLKSSPELRNDPQALNRLIEDTLLPHFDFNGLSRLTLGKHWKRASDEQREAFTGEFRELLVRTYSSVLSNYSNQRIEFLASKLSKNSHRATVKTRVVEPGAPAIAIDYRLRQVKGSWKIYDVLIEGASLAVNYRNSFSEEIKQHGLDGLIAHMMSQNAKGCVTSNATKTSTVQC